MAILYLVTPDGQENQLEHNNPKTLQEAKIAMELILKGLLARQKVGEKYNIEELKNDLIPQQLEKHYFIIKDN